MVTPKDIQTKKFGYSVRGYNKREVDEFLDAITIDYQDVLEKQAKLEQENKDLKATLEESQKNEHSVMNTLEQAKRLMSDISESAEKRAEGIIKNAYLDAQTITRNAKDSVSTYIEQSEQMKNKLAAFRTRFKQFMSDETGRMDSSVEELFADLGEVVPDVDDLASNNNNDVNNAPSETPGFTHSENTSRQTRVFTMPEEAKHDSGNSDHTMVFGKDELKHAAENSSSEKYTLNDLFNDSKEPAEDKPLFSDGEVTDEFGSPSDAMIDGKKADSFNDEPDTSFLKDAPDETKEAQKSSGRNFDDKGETVVMNRDDILREFEKKQ